MDRGDLEPSYRVLKAQRRMQKLLRRADGKAPASDGEPQLRTGLSTVHPRASLRNAPQMEKTPNGIREFHERPFS